MNSDTATLLVFGDLHGRVLPAFRLATAWAREHRIKVDGLLQVGDVGYFPDLSRLDKATIRHANDDPLELGVQDVIRATELADTVFNDPHCPPHLWFTAGNHEDFDELGRLSAGNANCRSFAVDHYCRMSCIQDGRVEVTAGQRVAAVWGVDGAEGTRRKKLPDRGYIKEQAVDRLLRTPFDVLLCHDAPYSAKRTGYGSQLLAMLIELSQPAFVFFGHYKGEGNRSDRDFGRSEVYHMAGFELRGPGNTAEAGSVGVLRWESGQGTFDYLDTAWLRTFTRHNWKYR